MPTSLSMYQVFQLPLCILMACASQLQAQAPIDWQLLSDPSIKNSAQTLDSGASGLVFLNQHTNDNRALVVHDAKLPRSTRLSIVTMNEGYPQHYQRLVWRKKKPVDAEAICAIPMSAQDKDEQQFLLAESSGTLIKFQLDLNNLSVRTLQHRRRHLFRQMAYQDTKQKGKNGKKEKGSGKQIEGLACLHNKNGSFLIWAHRGAGKVGATLFFARINFETLSLSDVQHWNIHRLGHIKNAGKRTRWISDIAIHNNGVYVSSTYDGGNAGPFESMVHLVGHIQYSPAEQVLPIRFAPLATPVSLTSLIKYKIEAITFNADQHLILASDDEKKGGKIGLLKTVTSAP